MASSPEVQAQFDAVLRSGAFREPKTMERLTDRLMKSGKVELALELLDLALQGRVPLKPEFLRGL